MTTINPVDERQLSYFAGYSKGLADGLKTVKSLSDAMCELAGFTERKRMTADKLRNMLQRTNNANSSKDS